MVSPFALLKIDSQPSVKLCSLRGIPINKPCAEPHPTQAGGNTAPTPFYVLLRLNSCGKESREKKTSDIPHILCKEKLLCPFTQHRSFTQRKVNNTDSKAMYIVGGAHLSVARKLNENSGSEQHKLC